VLQGVDLDHGRLIYACEGMAVTPEVEAAVTAAQATWAVEAPAEAPITALADLLAAAPVAVLPGLVPDLEPPAPSAVDPAAAAVSTVAQERGQDATHGHHHHRHRHLLQTTHRREWAAPWPFLVSDSVGGLHQFYCSCVWNRLQLQRAQQTPDRLHAAGGCLTRLPQHKAPELTTAAAWPNSRPPLTLVSPAAAHTQHHPTTPLPPTLHPDAPMPQIFESEP
jgi:hypothetical protein